MMIDKATQSALVGQSLSLNRTLTRIIEKLSTGTSINRSSDDAAGLAIAENLNAMVRGFRQASDNVAYAEAAMHIGEGATNEIAGMLQRQRELAVQASNGTLSDENRQALNQEFQQLSQEIDRVAQSAQFNTQGTAAGADLASGTAQVQAGPQAGDQVALPAADFRAATLGVDVLDISTAAGATSALGGLDTAINQVNTGRSALGAMINRFEAAQSNLQGQTVNTQAAESTIRDLDFAMGVADLVRNQVLGQSSNQALSMFNMVSKQNLGALVQGIF